MFTFPNTWISICSISLTTDTLGFRSYLYFFNNKFHSFWDFIILPNLNSNPNNLVEVLFLLSLFLLKFYWLFLVDCLMCMTISFIALKISKSSLPGSIPINLQKSSRSIAFCLFVFWLYYCHCDHFHQFLLWAYSHENTSQSCNLKHYMV